MKLLIWIIILLCLSSLIIGFCIGYNKGFESAKERVSNFYLNEYDWVQHLRLKNDIRWGQLDSDFVYRVIMNNTKQKFKGLPTIE